MDRRWRRSSASGDSGNCAEVAFSARVGVRDSKHPDARLSYPRPAWRALLALLQEPAREQRR